MCFAVVKCSVPALRIYPQPCSENSLCEKLSTSHLYGGMCIREVQNQFEISKIKTCKR